MTTLTTSGEAVATTARTCRGLERWCWSQCLGSVIPTRCLCCVQVDDGGRREGCVIRWGRASGGRCFQPRMYQVDPVLAMPVHTASNARYDAKQGPSPQDVSLPGFVMRDATHSPMLHHIHVGQLRGAGFLFERGQDPVATKPKPSSTKRPLNSAIWWCRIPWA